MEKKIKKVSVEIVFTTQINSAGASIEAFLQPQIFLCWCCRTFNKNRVKCYAIPRTLIDDDILSLPVLNLKKYEVSKELFLQVYNNIY